MKRLKRGLGYSLDKEGLTWSCCPTAMEIWCYKRIPVEGNFGQTYDSLNQSIHGLYGEFSANIDIKVGGRGVGQGEKQIGSRRGGRKAKDQGRKKDK